MISQFFSVLIKSEFKNKDHAAINTKKSLNMIIFPISIIYLLLRSAHDFTVKTIKVF